ncbi:hypothetical protein N7537_007494 [Penicillium hordei]|uniref:Uncharacterized protein n=1 Tax=Penicillium hordei TaxID=40994 RepID=A0AAD6GXJ0_9EURO|nr:uncharacterized protein N7537_007494 [Penicillium hordei]KAJ5597410.1 hypothetical protein N7537_007494 [Penicillium hordei]
MKAVTHQWLDSLRPSTNDSSEHILTSTFSEFVISENKGLASHPNSISDPVSWNINASKNAWSNNPKHLDTLHQRMAAHTSKDCFQNLANTKSANAVNTPATTTTTAPTSANTLICNPMVR